MQNIIIWFCDNNILPLLCIEGGLLPADVKIMRHISAEYNSKIKKQIEKFPFIFDKDCSKYSYLLGGFELTAGFTVMNLKYRYSTPAEMLLKKRPIRYETAALVNNNTFGRMCQFNGSKENKKVKYHGRVDHNFYTILYFLNKLSNKEKICCNNELTPAAVKYFKMFVDEVYKSDVERKVIILEDKIKSISNIISYLLQEGIEEEAAAICLYYYKTLKINIENYGILDMIVRLGRFKFLSIIDIIMNFDNNDIFKYNLDVMKQNFVDNAAGLDFLLQIYFRRKIEN